MLLRSSLLVLMFAACQTSTSSPEVAAPVAAVPPAVAAKPAQPARPVRVSIGPDSDKIDPSNIIGKPASWDVEWIGGPAIAAGDLRGQVVLVRWFTEGCPYCLATAPTLAALHDELGGKGLRVIGMYHHKSLETLDPARVQTFARERLGFKFPIAIDRDWKTLRAWWPHEGFTSVSFVIDKQGVVRFVHTGGSYAPGTDEAKQMRAWIDQLLAEPQR